MKKILLLIDDDDDDQNLFINELRDYNPDIKVLSAFNGKQGLEMLNEVEPNWIFVDINMPIMNGFEVLKTIKQERLEIPVFIYSTNDSSNNRNTAIQLGAEEYFRKPHSSEELLKIFQQVFTKN